MIEVCQQIYNEILPGKPDAGPLMVIKLFRSHLTRISLKEFDEILYQTAIVLFDDYIEVKYNTRMCVNGTTEYENSELDSEEIVKLAVQEMNAPKAVRAWIRKNENRKVLREAIEGIEEYNYQFPPLLIPAPLEKPKAGEFVVWKTSGINPIGPIAWLCAQNHWWEFAPRWETLVLQAVQQLAFNTHGEHRGRTKIDYLTEDLEFGKDQKLKRFYQLLQAHSEAQPYYPTISADAEVVQIEFILNFDTKC